MGRQTWLASDSVKLSDNLVLSGSALSDCCLKIKTPASMGGVWVNKGTARPAATKEIQPRIAEDLVQIVRTDACTLARK